MSSADELREVLGTTEGTSKKTSKEKSSYQDNEKYDYKKDSSNELVYRDSSMFLKVS